ncbi:hypothetical protein ACSCBZ_45900 [Streptomyces niveiscabiei]|uniref:hypothetical protein n=1 Tax=Streptomyces niveiscabiei TaxID=164115 RepID=UPI000AFB289D|nr:hypothetical protein [Streptomyces niveiscabiei]
MTGATVPRSAGVGDLVRDTSRDCQAVLTDVRAGLPYLRLQFGSTFTEPWPATWESVELIAKRGTWEAS